MNPSSKVAIVTGAGTGIGKAAAVALAAQVHATNEINGVLVEARLKSNQAAIAALQAAANSSSVYGPEGGTRLTDTPSRTLASA